jgi:hypothetical protein
MVLISILGRLQRAVTRLIGDAHLGPDGELEWRDFLPGH